MTPHTFIFTPGRWLGKGTITIQGASHPLKCYLRWDAVQAKGEAFSATKTVEIEGVKEHVVTSYFFTDFEENSFAVFLDNPSIGQVMGKGVIQPDSITWEFHSPLLKGFDSYKRNEDGTYSLHAEFSSSNEYRTVIEGVLWKKAE